MAKITLNDISSNYASTAQLNSKFQQIEDELNNKALYRNNPLGEANTMENDLDMNSNDILNANAVNTAELYIEGRRVTIDTVLASGNSLLHYPTIAQMKNDTGLSAGDFVRTQGYSTSGDSGGALYVIQTAANFGATPDEYGDHTLDNGNIAVLQHDGSNLYMNQFGVVGDGVTDDTPALQAAGDATPQGATLHGDASKTYRIVYQDSTGQCLKWTHGFTLDFHYANISFKTWSSTTPANNSPAIMFSGSLDDPASVNSVTTAVRFFENVDPTVYDDVEVGDWFFVKSEDGRQAWDYPEESTLFYAIGEIKEVRAKFNTGPNPYNVVFDSPFEVDYTTNVKMWKLNFCYFPVVRNFNAVEDDQGTQASLIEANNGHFCTFYTCYAPVMENGTMVDNRLCTVWTENSPYGRMENVHSKTDKTTYQFFGGHSYNIRWTMSRYGLTKNTSAIGARHAIDYSSAHDCYSVDNSAVSCTAGAYSCHGTYDNRIYSLRDKASGSGTGWFVGNPDFGPSRNVYIQDFVYAGAGAGIWIGSDSYNVHFNNCIFDFINAESYIQIARGANHIYFTDCVFDGAKRGTTDYLFQGNCYTDSSFALGGGSLTLTSATGSAGVNPSVTFQFSGDHDREIGDVVYYNILDNEYQGNYTITSLPSSSSFIATFDGTTSGGLSTSGSAEVVFPEGNFKPDTGYIYFDGCEIIDDYPFYVGWGGDFVMRNCRITGLSDTKINPIRLEATWTNGVGRDLILDNLVVDPDITQESMIGTTNMAYERVSITNCKCLDYDNAFINSTAKLFRTDVNRVFVFENNDASTSNTLSASKGIFSYNMWDKIRDLPHMRLSGNAYPTTASFTNYTNDSTGANINWEQGRWTPTAYGTTTAGSYTYTAQQGEYTLSGNRIEITARVAWSATTGTGNLQITTPTRGSFIATPLGLSWSNLTYTNIPKANWVSGGTYIEMIDYGSGGGGGSFAWIDAADIADFYVTGSVKLED